MKKLSYREVIEAQNICYCIKRYMPTYVNSKHLNEKFYSNNKKEALIESNCRRKYSYSDLIPIDPPLYEMPKFKVEIQETKKEEHIPIFFLLAFIIALYSYLYWIIHIYKIFHN